MKKNIHIIKWIFAVFMIYSFTACNEDLLDETPSSFLSPSNTFVTKAGFMNAIYGLHTYLRSEQTDNSGGVSLIYELNFGTDIAGIGEHYAGSPTRLWDYSLLNSNYTYARMYWNWAYQKVIANANLIIANAESQIDVLTADEKTAIMAEAKFGRAYAYNVLVNLFGGVPIVLVPITEPKLDFVRATKLEVLQQIEKDLVDAAAGLPAVEEKDGRISKAAANHLLSEVYISLGLATNDATNYDKSIAAASSVINDPRYKLMTARFGAKRTLPGDVFHDLFWDYNVNRSSGNTETIWAIQFENLTTGGGANWSNWARAWGPRYFENLPYATEGSKRIVDDTLGRPVGWLRGNNYIFYDIWQDDWNDMRNSKYNMVRQFYYNTGPRKGQLIVPNATTDTMFNYYPYIGKLQGDFLAAGIGMGYTPKDIYKMRLAETYLLRAEAYMWKGGATNLALAADDINVVRARANAIPVLPEDVDIDYILDERARELMVEESRKLTLTRVGKLYERVNQYNYSSVTGWGAKVQPHNELWPIPQEAIDANVGAVLEQNPGYN